MVCEHALYLIIIIAIVFRNDLNFGDQKRVKRTSGRHIVIGTVRLLGQTFLETLGVSDSAAGCNGRGTSAIEKEPEKESRTTSVCDEAWRPRTP